jgi:hypothetical protein
MKEVHGPHDHLRAAFLAERGALDAAIANAPFAQQALLHAVDATYAFLDASCEALSSEEVLDLEVRLRHAETMLGRYFGS